MSYRLKNHPQPVNVGPSLNIEALAIELFVGALLTIMGIGGYQTGVALMFIPCFMVAFICYFLVIISIYRFISDKIRQKRQESPNIDT